MIAYLVRRLFLLPLTLFAIILVNFVILNLAPADPVNMANLSATGEAQRSSDDAGSSGDHQYLLFREHYGLTLPILFNLWPSLSPKDVRRALHQFEHKEEMSVQDYHDLKTLWGDRARFIMPYLLDEAKNSNNSLDIRRFAANLFIRGGTKQGHTGVFLTEEERNENRQFAKRNLQLNSLKIHETDTSALYDEKISKLILWYEEEGGLAHFSLSGWKKVNAFFFETRFFRYLRRVLFLDFGTLRNDSNKLVIHEVAKRMKYSLTLAVVPMLITFALCQIFGMIMAVKQNSWPDYSLNIFFLILFALPVFVVAPFLIEKVALNHMIPFTHISLPYSGFHSPEEAYNTFTSSKRLFDVSLHLILPLFAIMYGTLALQARLSRTAFLEVMKQDHIRTAKAKGLPLKTILIKHVGRPGSITIVTSLAASLGIVLGGSLIVETIFEMNGFGRFFYQAILNRDYNVVLFSAFAGSFLTLVGYLVADIAYTVLDPRVSFE